MLEIVADLQRLGDRCQAFVADIGTQAEIREQWLSSRQGRSAARVATVVHAGEGLAETVAWYRDYLG